MKLNKLPRWIYNLNKTENKINNHQIENILENSSEKMISSPQVKAIPRIPKWMKKLKTLPEWFRDKELRWN